MAVSRQERRAGRAARVRAVFGADAEAVLDLLELTELAWHDCYGEVSPPEQVIDDILAASGGATGGVVRAARLAVEDSRDLALRARDAAAPVPVPSPVRLPAASTPPRQLPGERVLLVPVATEHVPALRGILDTPQVRSRWGDEAVSPQWPFDDPSATRFAVVVEGRTCGMVQYAEEDEPAYRHASIDIFLDPEVHGRGLGRDAVRTLARHLVGDLGHHRLVIDPAADNEAAVRSYTAVGFRPVGVMRR